MTTLTVNPVRFTLTAAKVRGNTIELRAETDIGGRLCWRIVRVRDEDGEEFSAGTMSGDRRQDEALSYFHQRVSEYLPA